MICQRRVTAGEDLKLGHSCPSEPYRASIFVFLAERDNLSVPRGPRQNGWDHLTPDHPSGIWGMALSLHGAHHTGEVSSLNCVYLLAPCRENLPINCMLILSLNDPMVFFLPFSFTNHHFNRLISLWTSPLRSSSTRPLHLTFFPLLSTFGCLDVTMHLDLQIPNTYT